MLEIFTSLKSLIYNKSFFLGAVLAFSMFSHYIFGNDNLLEQFGELFIFETSGKNIDFTPENQNLSTETISTIVEVVKDANK